MNHSEQTHAQLVARIPEATGRGLGEWMATLDAGPGLLRFDERVNWLRSEHDLPHSFASAIVHEHALARAARRSS